VTSSSVPKGVVAAVSPVPGSDVPTGSVVDMTVSIGPA
jgi:beta-lactam-binding protein with PASTA domain